MAPEQGREETQHGDWRSGRPGIRDVAAHMGDGGWGLVEASPGQVGMMGVLEGPTLFHHGAGGWAGLHI